MTREEAIKILRDAHDKALFSVRNALENLIPELRESEDERIRKFLIEILSHGTWRKEWPFGPNEVVAYLEKQKEQKPQDQCVDVIKMSALLAADRLASAEMTGRLKERKEILENPEKYGLCKPAEWSEEDEK